MSAYLVSHATINGIVGFAARHFPDRQVLENLRTGDAQRAGEILFGENNRSVNYRYGDNTPTPRFAFDHKGELPDNMGGFCKLLSCLEYQSCEADDWHTTPAFRIIARFRELACEAFAGYEAAPWGLHDPEPVAANVVAFRGRA